MCDDPEPIRLEVGLLQRSHDIPLHDGQLPLQPVQAGVQLFEPRKRQLVFGFDGVELAPDRVAVDADLVVQVREQPGRERRELARDDAVGGDVVVERIARLVRVVLRRRDDRETRGLVEPVETDEDVPELATLFDLDVVETAGSFGIAVLRNDMSVGQA